MVILIMSVSVSGEDPVGPPMAGEMEEWVITETFGWGVPGAVEYSPEGEFVGVATSRGLYIVDSDTKEILCNGTHESRLYSLDWSPSGDRIVTGSDDGVVKVWDATTCEEVVEMEVHDSDVLTVSWKPTGMYIAAGYRDGNISLFNAVTGAISTNVSAHTDDVRTVEWSPDGVDLVSCSYDRTVRIWNGITWEMTQEFESDLYVQAVTWHPTLNRIAYGGSKNLVIANSMTGLILADLTGHESRINTVGWNHDGSMILTGDGRDNVILWDDDPSLLEPLPTILVNTTFGYGDATSISWSPDGTEVALSFAFGDEVAFIDGDDLSELHVIDDRYDFIHVLEWSPTGDRLAISNYQNETIIIDMVGDAPDRVIGNPSTQISITELSWSPDGTRYAVVNTGDMMSVWDVSSGTELFNVLFPDSDGTAVAWSPDGTRIAGATWYGDLFVWDASDGSVVMENRTVEIFTDSIAWSPDGTRLALADGYLVDGERTIQIRSALDGSLIRTLPGHDMTIKKVIWSPDDLLFSCASDGLVKVWDADDGQLIHNVSFFEEGVADIALDPTGTRLLVGGYWYGDDTYIFDHTNGTILTVIDDTFVRTQLDWSSNGRIAHGSSDGFIQILDPYVAPVAVNDTTDDDTTPTDDSTPVVDDDDDDGLPGPALLGSVAVLLCVTLVRRSKGHRRGPTPRS